MALAAVIVKDLGPSRMAAVAAIRKGLRVGLSEVNRAVTSGTPLIARELFANDDPEFATRLLALIEEFDRLGAVVDVSEVPPGESFDATKVDGYWKITADRLRTLIRARAKSIDQIRFRKD